MKNKPPLGILFIGNYLKDKTGFEVKLLDNQLENLNDRQLIRFIRSFKPSVVGISVVSFKLYPAYRITQVIKKNFPSIHLCWGGPHLSIFPQESLRLPRVDSIILGDGEIPFTRLCQNLSQGKKIKSITGLYTLENEPSSNRQFKHYTCQDLNKLPLPDLTLLPYQRYRAFLTQSSMATAITSKGCPYRCIFCKLDFSKVRLLSIDRVIQLVESYLKLGIKEIEFYDETFNLNPQRVIDFANQILKKDLKFKWSFRGRVSPVNAKMLKLAKKAGCQRIQYGVEAGTNRVLRILKKGVTLKDIRRCFRLTNQAAIETVAYFILGSPGETLEEMSQTIKLAKEIKPTYLEYAIFNISPGTESYEMALKAKVIQRDYWQEYAQKPTPKMPILIWNKNYSHRQLEKIRKKALRSFYARPSYILNRLVQMKPTECRQIFKTGIHLLKEALVNDS